MKFDALKEAVKGPQAVAQVRALVLEWGVNATDEKGASVFQRLIEALGPLSSRTLDANRQPLLDMMVAEGVNTEAPHSDSGYPLLLHALMHDNVRMAHYVLRAGGDPSVSHGKLRADGQVASLTAQAEEHGCGANVLNAYDSYDREVENEAGELWYYDRDLTPSLIAQGSDGTKRLSALARCLCENNKLQYVMDAAPRKKSMTPESIAQLAADLHSLLPERHRDKLDSAAFLRNAPVRPDGEVVVRYAQQSVTTLEEAHHVG